MRIRFALVWAPLVLAFAVALPATAVAATGYTFSIVDQHCYGAQHQDVYFRVKVVAASSTPANKLTIKSKSQYFSGGKWHTYYRWATDQTTFTPNGQAHSLDYSYTHEGTNQYDWRIVSTLKAWNGSAVLAHKTLTSSAC